MGETALQASSGCGSCTTSAPGASSGTRWGLGRPCRWPPSWPACTAAACSGPPSSSAPLPSCASGCASCGCGTRRSASSSCTSPSAPGWQPGRPGSERLHLLHCVSHASTYLCTCILCPSRKQALHHPADTAPCCCIICASCRCAARFIG